MIFSVLTCTAYKPVYQAGIETKIKLWFNLDYFVMNFFPNFRAGKLLAFYAFSIILSFHLIFFQGTLQVFTPQQDSFPLEWKWNGELGEPGTKQISLQNWTRAVEQDWNFFSPHMWQAADNDLQLLFFITLCDRNLPSPLGHLEFSGLTGMGYPHFKKFRRALSEVLLFSCSFLNFQRNPTLFQMCFVIPKNRIAFKVQNNRKQRRAEKKLPFRAQEWKLAKSNAGTALYHSYLSDITFPQFSLFFRKTRAYQAS